jgi:hypothetical protein
MAGTPDVVFNFGVDAKGLTTEITKYANQVKGLQNEFMDMSRTAQTGLNAQKQALAQLLISGREGSKEYNDLLASMKKISLEANKMQEALSHIDKEIDIHIKANTKGFDNEINSLKTKSQGIFGSILGGSFLGAGLAGGVAEGLRMVKEFAKVSVEKGKEVAEINEELKIGFKTAGVAAADMGKFLQLNEKSSASLGQKYAIDNDEINKLTATYLKMGGTVDNLSKKQEMILGLAKRGGIDYEMAAKALTKATDPEIEAQLTKMGIKFEKNATEAERFAKINEALAGTFKGMEEAANSDLGQMQKLSILWEDIQEAAGGALLGVIGGLMPVIRQGAEVIQKTIVPLIENLMSKLGPAITKIVEMLMPIINDVLAGISELLEPIGDIIVMIVENMKPLVKIIVDVLKDFIKDNMPLLKDTLVLIADLLRAILPIIIPILEIMIKVGLEISTWMIKLNLFIANLEVKLFKAIQSLYEPVKEVFTNIYEFISGVWTGLYEGGLKYFIQPIEIAFNWLYDNVIAPIIKAYEWVVGQEKKAPLAKSDITGGKPKPLGEAVEDPNAHLEGEAVDGKEGYYWHWDKSNYKWVEKKKRTGGGGGGSGRVDEFKSEARTLYSLQEEYYNWVKRKQAENIKYDQEIYQEDQKLAEKKLKDFLSNWMITPFGLVPIGIKKGSDKTTETKKEDNIFASMFDDANKAVNDYFDNIKKLNEDQTKSQREELGKQFGDLKKNLQNGTLAYEDAMKQYEELSDKRIELEKESAEKVFNIWDAANASMRASYRALYNDYSKTLEQKTKDGTATMQDYINTSIAQMALLTSEGMSFGNAMLMTIADMGIKYLGMKLPEWIASIFGESLGQFGPIVGAILAATATAGLIALVASAKSSLSSAKGADEGVIGIDEGYNKRPSARDLIPLLVRKGESVITPEGTLKWGETLSNEELLKVANRGQSIENYVMQRRQTDHVMSYVQKSQAVTPNGQLISIDGKLSRIADILESGHHIELHSKHQLIAPKGYSMRTVTLQPYR